MLTIGQVAAASNVTTSTLRFYDDEGLVPPHGRSEAGYRLYQPEVIERLRFIRRAKDLGCTVPEVKDLLIAWDGGQCGSLQDELRPVVADKVAAARERLADTRAALADLERAALALESHRPIGPCDDRCGCVAPPDESSVEPVDIGLGRGAPDECSLPSVELPQRTRDWQTLMQAVVARQPLADGLRLEFCSDVDVAEVARLIVAEQGCCTFFGFALTADDRGVGLDINVPAEHRQLLDDIFAMPTATN